MEAWLVSTFSVAIAEIGDRTQLLSLLLAARYRRFWPLALGVLVATVLNHGLAASVGQWLAAQMSAEVLRWLSALAFVAVALWTLRPDRLDDDAAPATARSAFFAATTAFFVAEIGDKTQIATVLLATSYPAVVAVVAGSTLGMLLANWPVLALGAAFAERLPLRAARYSAALLFVALALAIILRG